MRKAVTFFWRGWLTIAITAMAPVALFILGRSWLGGFAASLWLIELLSWLQMRSFARESDQYDDDNELLGELDKFLGITHERRRLEARLSAVPDTLAMINFLATFGCILLVFVGVFLTLISS